MSRISDQAAQAVAAIAGFQQVLPGALTAKAKEALQADNTNALQGNDFATTSSNLDGELTTHLAQINPHNDQANAVGAYSKTQVNTKLNGMIPNASLPLSRFGSLSYLPVNVSGSFQGASTNLESRAYPMVVENDGTLVMLRNGTTGSVQGVYYAYSNNILAAGSGSQVLSPLIRTSKQYAPAYFPSGYTARNIWRSDSQVLVGRLQDASGNLSDWFISLTNGTFDDTKHTGCLVSNANMPIMFRGGQQAPDTFTEVFLASDAVYFVVPPDCESNNSPVDFQIWKLPIAAVRAGGYQTPSQLSNWSTTGFYGTVSNANLRFAAVGVSTNSANQPLILDSMTPVTGGSIQTAATWDNGFSTISAQDPVTGKMRTCCFGHPYVNKADQGYAIVVSWLFSFTWDPNAMTASLDAEWNTPGTISGAVGDPTPTYSGKIFQFVGQAKKWDPTLQDNSGHSHYFHPAGWWMAQSDSNQPDLGSMFGRGKIASVPPSKFAALNFAQYPIVQNDFTNYTPSYGSAIGGMILGPTVLPNGWGLIYCYGKNNAGAYATGMVLYQTGSAKTYGSLQYGSLNGFAPTTNRQFLTDLGFNPMTYGALLSEINTSGVVSTSGGVIAEGFATSGPLSVNEALTTSGTVSVSASLFASVRAAMWSAAGLGTPSVKGAYTSFMIPQNTAIPCFAYTHWVNAAGEEWALLAELSVTAGSRTGNITGFNVVSVSNPIRNTGNGGPSSSMGPNNTMYQQSGGMTIYEASDCWMVGGAGKHFVNRPGWNGSFNFAFAIPKTSNRPDWSNLKMSFQWEQFSTQFYGAVPGVGFGLYDQSPVGSDYNTKLLFKLVATNLSQFNAWATQAQSTWRVMVSQDVAQGWLAYFTDITPVIMNGQYLQLQPATIDLTKIKSNPANTTFYVYVTTSGSVASYSVSTSPQAEAMNMMFIGTIVTGTSAITSINMQKVSRIDKYRLSVSSAGSAISVTSGTPDAAQHLNWT